MYQEANSAPNSSRVTLKNRSLCQEKKGKKRKKMAGLSNICQQLVKKRWYSYDDGLQKAKGEGIYVIGEKTAKGKIEYLYGGHSKDIHRRLREHKTQNLAIDKHIKKQYLKNGGRNLRVKWEGEKKSKQKEGKYIQCLKKTRDKKLKYNKKKGNNS